MKIKVKVAEKKQVSKKISTDFIKLDSFLKMCDAVQTVTQKWLFRTARLRLTARSALSAVKNSERAILPSLRERFIPLNKAERNGLS